MKKFWAVVVSVVLMLTVLVLMAGKVVEVLNQDVPSEWQAGLVAGAVAFVAGVLVGVRLNQSAQDRHAQSMTALLWTQADITRHTAGMGKEFARADREQAGMEAKLRFMEEKRTDQILGQIASTVVRHTARQQERLPDATWQVGEVGAAGDGVKLIGRGLGDQRSGDQRSGGQGAGPVERYD